MASERVNDGTMASERVNDGTMASEWHYGQ